MSGEHDRAGGAGRDAAAGNAEAEGAPAAQTRGDGMSDQLTPEQTCRRALAVLDEVEKAVVGKRAALELVMLGVLAGGHVLIEDLPGLGKTLMARSFATALGLDFRRIQFTPDLLPSDVTGAPFYDQRTGDMVFRPGPVFTHLLLADEINRTPPKTQAALLEAMAEAQVSIDGSTRPLPDPFVVHRHRQPDRVRGHVHPARGPARPLPAAGAHGLPHRAEESRDAARRGSTAPRPRRAAHAQRPRRGAGDARRRGTGRGRRRPAGLRRRAGRRHPRATRTSRSAPRPRGGLALVSSPAPAPC